MNLSWRRHYSFGNVKL